MADAQEQAKPAGGAAAEGSILDEIMVQTKLKPTDEGYDVAKKGVQASITHRLAGAANQKADKKLVDQMISEIDGKVSKQLDAVMHNASFQKLESAWRGLKLLVDRTDFRENNRIALLNCSKDDLITDFEDSPEIVKSGLYKTVYTGEYGQFGGEPYGAMIANYDFGPGPQDMALLGKVASVATMSHAPVKAFNYGEDVKGQHTSYLWGSSSFAFATRLADSFAKWRMCANIIGPTSGGAVEDLPLHQFESMGEIETKVPTEILISERREYELSEEGFIALSMRKGSDNACFFSANSCQKAKKFGQSKEGKEAELNYRLGTQLPYLFVVNRLAHYIKVLQREQIGSWKEKEDLQRELNTWIRQYVVDMDNPAPSVRSRCPLRAAQITVEDVPGEAGWYKVDMKVRPHFKYMGAFFTLSLVGKLDKK